MVKAAQVEGIQAGSPIAAPLWLSRGERVVALAIGIAALSVLLVAARLEPSPTGVGTHQQLMLPPCTWPFVLGVPCPACGMTTAFAHAARADLLSSFVAQPAGMLLALGTAAMAVMGVFAAVTGTRVMSMLSPLASSRGLTAVVAILLLSWGYKILEFRQVWPLAPAPPMP